MFAGNVFAQSSLTLPEIVEPDQEFIISWPAWGWREFNDHHDDDAESFERETGYKIERYDPSSDVWVTVFFPRVANPYAESYNSNETIPTEYVESVSDEGVYEYRLTRDFLTSEDEDDDDGSYTNYNSSSFTEFSITIVVASLVSNQVLCGPSVTQDCITIYTPQDLSVSRTGESYEANISWEALAESVERYELEYFNNTYNQWEIIYAGEQLSFSFDGLTSGVNQFRVRACQAQLCGKPTLAQVVDIEFVNITEHQCEPIL